MQSSGRYQSISIQLNVPNKASYLSTLVVEGRHSLGVGILGLGVDHHDRLVVDNPEVDSRPVAVAAAAAAAQDSHRIDLVVVVVDRIDPGVHHTDPEVVHIHLVEEAIEFVRPFCHMCDRYYRAAT
jgi:hypothetical protein